MEKTDTVAGVVVVVAELLPSLNGVFLEGIGSKPNRVNLPILTLINWSEKIAEFLTAVVTSSSIPDNTIFAPALWACKDGRNSIVEGMLALGSELSSSSLALH